MQLILMDSALRNLKCSRLTIAVRRLLISMIEPRERKNYEEQSSIHRNKIASIPTIAWAFESKWNDFETRQMPAIPVIESWVGLKDVDPRVRQVSG